MIVVRKASTALAALLDLWLWVIAIGGVVSVVLAGMVSAGAVPRSSAPSPEAAGALAHSSREAWAAILASVADVSSGQRGCRVVLGFGRLEALLGRAITGECVEDERFDPRWGVAAQSTTRGLFVFRRADGTLAFTDGYRTWLLGSNGLQRRLNTQRLCWEPDADQRTCLRN